MRYYRFQLKKPAETPLWLESRTDFFEFTDADGLSWLYIPLSSDTEANQVLKENVNFEKVETVDLKDYVDWGVQWENHSPDFKDYRLEIDLAKYSNDKKKYPKIFLNAGPGFGDLSHPTTRLVLAMMAPYVKNKTVIDVGCGSGILSIAALLMGAQEVYAIDIDPEALSHTKENSRLNNFEDKIHISLPQDFKKIPKESIILMNMIQSHQQDALASLPQLLSLSTIWIISGILNTETKSYLKECSKRGWNLQEEQRQEDWMAFRFLS